MLAPTTIANTPVDLPVDVEGDTLVVGYPMDRLVFVYTRSGHDWTLAATITPPPSATFTTQFGCAVALDLAGGTLAIGCKWYQDTGATPQGGAVLVYTGAGSSWTLEGTLMVPAPVAGDQLGFSVAIDGNTVVAGAPKRDLGALTDVGAVEVFTRSGVVWSHAQELMLGTPSALDELGYAVDIDGATIVAGAPYWATLNTGAVQVFDYVGSTWSTGQFIPYAWQTIATGGDRFGWSVTLTGDALAVGAPYSSGLCNQGTPVTHGRVDLFDRLGGLWIHNTVIAPPPPDLCGVVQLFGWSLDSDDTRILVGEPSSGYFVQYGGNSYLCDWSGGRAQGPVPSTPTGGDWFGSNVALDGDTLVVTAPRVMLNLYRGFTYVFVPELSVVDRMCFGVANCPCGNNDTPANCQQGCGNSTLPNFSRGAFAVGLGTSRVLTNDLEVKVWNVKPFVLCTLFAGSQPILGGGPFGAGLRCAGVPQRLGNEVATADGSARWVPGIVGQAGWNVGDVRWLQVYYRDPTGPCSTFNLSNAIEVTVQ